MSLPEAPEPILNSPFDEPTAHWHIVEGSPPERRVGRRPAMYWYRREDERPEPGARSGIGTAIELKLVNLIREKVRQWRDDGYRNATRTTLELLSYWSREGRKHRLFFAQREAVETVIFLVEARADYLQGINIPRDELSDERRAEGYKAFTRYACKMATGSGKSTVMAMLSAWSILNKVANRSDQRFSDVVLIVCPNVTIRDRLAELDPRNGEASVYRTRDLVPAARMDELRRGRVLVTNWHVFEPQTMQVGGVSARVHRAGVAQDTVETITIGERTTTARGRRYLTLADFEMQVRSGMLTLVGEPERDKAGAIVRAKVRAHRYVESDTKLLERILGRDVGGKRNVLVMNDEAHHAYRIRPSTEESDLPEDDDDEDEEEEESRKEATVWVEGLDRIHKHRGINFCVDLSATPFYLARIGQDAGRPFPWVVSDFGLIDAIESGLVKIPQLVVRDSTGAEMPGYFNIWQWVMQRLTPAERGGKRSAAKPEAILKWAHTPIAMLAGLWQKDLDARANDPEDRRPPVFILVCKNTQLAKVMYEWLAEGQGPAGIPPANIAGFRNGDGVVRTIRVDSKVVKETDTGAAKTKESRWMRFTLDTVGKVAWPSDSQGRPIYPEGFEALAKELERPLHPPGRDIHCIVSVGMLTEGWDCNTVTHIVGLRPFMSQLLCEQVVGRGLRRRSYAVDESGKFTEEVSKVFGVPFEVIPFKQSKDGPAPARRAEHHVRALPNRAEYEIKFPRVEGYTRAVRNRITVDWSSIASLEMQQGQIPTEVQMKAGLPNNKGRITLSGPGRVEGASLEEYRSTLRMQQTMFQIASAITKEYLRQPDCEAPAFVLFPQVFEIVRRYVQTKIKAFPPCDPRDIALSPYYGYVIERLLTAIRPDGSAGEAPELPLLESHRSDGSTSEVDFWTGRPVYEVEHSHVNYVVADTLRWEQSAAYAIDTHPNVRAFVKNAGLGFAIPYLHNGAQHDYIPDFIIRGKNHTHVILETKGHDPLLEVKRQAAERWVHAVNALGAKGHWSYALVTDIDTIRSTLDRELG